MQEIAIDYSDCLNAPRTFTNISSGKVSTYFKSSTCTQPITPQWKLGSRVVDYSPYGIQLNSSICSLQFTVPNNIGPPVLLYYRLTNFYQNHRRYVKSLDSNQLSGDAVPVSTITKGSCDPLRLGPKEKPYYPCGLIANSIFNDTFFNPVLTNVKDSAAGNRTYNMTNKGIAWDSDKSLYGKTKYSIENITVPPNWKERWPNGYTADNPPPDLSNYEEFQVWMRTAGLPAFSKLALRNDKEPMDCGTYQVDIALSTCLHLPQLNRAPVTNLFCRLSCYRVRRHQIYCNLHPYCHGREEPIPRHRLHCRCWYLRCSRSNFHRNAPHQT